MSAIEYRAVHTKTKWRKAYNHKSLASALEGRNGAVGLFAGTVRINYEKHGAPLYVFAWEDGAMEGWAIKPSGDVIVKKQVPVYLIMELEKSDGENQAALATLFA